MSAWSWFPDRISAPLLWATVGHIAIAVICLVALLFDATPITGVHPALKPFKFAVSIALFLATMGVVLEIVSVSSATRSALAWVFCTTMIAEMIPIGVQGLRGTTSHFNMSNPGNNAMWQMMVVAIVIATIAMFWLIVATWITPLVDRFGTPLDPVLTFAWRASLTLLALLPVSGFAMGGRGTHTIGGPDGGPGLPFLNWSTVFGDLRVAHFFALHSMQALPLIAVLVIATTTSTAIRWSTVLTATAISAALSIGTLLQAFAGKPLLQ